MPLAGLVLLQEFGFVGKTQELAVDGAGVLRRRGVATGVLRRGVATGVLRRRVGGDAPGTHW